MKVGVKQKPGLKDYSAVDLRQEPKAVIVTPVREPKEIRFAAEAGTCESRERVQGYNAGDAIVKDKKIPGDTKEYYYPITRSKFEILYEPYSSQKMGENGPYVKKQGHADLAMRINEPFSVKMSNGETLPGKTGDWLSQAADGAHRVVDAEVFKKTYQLAENMAI